MPLDQATLERLVAVKNKPKAGDYAAPVIGPLRYVEGLSRHCSKRGCVAPTNYAVQGAPKCTVHALEEMNEMLVGQGFKGVANVTNARPTNPPPHRSMTASVRAKLAVGFALTKFECVHGINLERECGECGLS